ncbi:MAG: hypothetical protein DRH32_00070 [Deltaproteobacteria bacterium]|nr:MAG: hypothetical protein DRH32_00070 [Deltaproteobacteria bacterium]
MFLPIMVFTGRNDNRRKHQRPQPGYFNRFTRAASGVPVTRATHLTDRALPDVPPFFRGLYKPPAGPGKNFLTILFG